MALLRLPAHTPCPALPRPVRNSPPPTHTQDARVVDNACVALSYIAEAAASQPPLLEALNSPGNGLVNQAIQLVGGAGGVRSMPHACTAACAATACSLHAGHSPGRARPGCALRCVLLQAPCGCSHNRTWLAASPAFAWLCHTSCHNS